VGEAETTPTAVQKNALATLKWTAPSTVFDSTSRASLPSTTGNVPTYLWMMLRYATGIAWHTCSQGTVLHSSLGFELYRPTCFMALQWHWTAWMLEGYGMQ